MEIVWEASPICAAPRRRVQACRSCRSRKKRCYHREDAPAQRSPLRVRRFAHDGRGRLEARTVETLPAPSAESSADPTRASTPNPLRENAYNPESVLSDLLSPSYQHSKTDLPRPQNRMAWYQKHKARRRALPQTITPAHQAYLNEIRAMIQVPRRTVEALLPLYISTLDDLMPLVNGPKLLRDWSNGNASACLIGAVCLVICKSPQASPFLWLDDSSLPTNQSPSAPLPTLEFASRLLTGLDAALKADLEPERITRVRVLAIMHLHTDGPGGLDRSLVHLGQAISEAWCLSLHHRQPSANDSAEAADKADEYALLWWTLRHLDRLNKPITAAGPFIIDDSNVGLARIGSDGRPKMYRQQVAQVATSLGDLMVLATRVYKPHVAERVDLLDKFPPFESVVQGVNLESFHASHRKYFEVWYHVAAMLSCRYSPPGAVQYERRLLSAEAVLHIVYGKEGGELQYSTIPPLPLVPYAMSMSTTVIYRALRDNKRELPTALANLHRCCHVLETLGTCWTSVHGICRLVKDICTTDDPSPSSPTPASDVQVEQHPSADLTDGTVDATSVNMTIPATYVGIAVPEVAALSSLIDTSDAALISDMGAEDLWASHLDPSSYFLMDPIFHPALDFGFSNTLT